jgi:plastocyanin
MRKLVVVAAAAALLAAGSTAIAQTAGVDITSAGFSPASQSIQAGDSVSWKNSDSRSHDVVVSGTSCNLSLKPAQSSSCTFPSPGTFSYSDPSPNGSGFNGTISVAPNSRSVTLATSRALNIFGDAVTLSGTVSSKNAGEKVTVVATPTGQPATETTVTTTSGGNWSLLVQPRVRTSYQAVYDNATSRSVAVSIRPRITLEKVGRHQYLVVVLAAHSMAGKTVNVTRWIPGSGWVTFRQATLQALARTPTTSVAYVTANVRLGVKLRIFMTADQVGSDYIPGHSNFIVN